MKGKTVIVKFKSSIQQIDKDATVILYGSRARGDNKKDSDWDFLVLTNLPDNKYTKDLFREKYLKLS